MEEFDTIYDFAKWCCNNKTGTFTETVNIHGEELSFDVYIEKQILFSTQEKINEFFILCTQEDANTQLIISDKILINEGLILIPPYRCKGLILFVNTLSNNGTISMTARGSSAEGNDLYLYKLNDEYQIVPKEGALGSDSYSRRGSGANAGQPGHDGIGRQTGGGGAGGQAHGDTTSTINYLGGGHGSSYSGGAGGGGVDINWSGYSYTQNRPDPGTGAGSDAFAARYSSSWYNRNAGGGAGNPGGRGRYASGYNVNFNGEDGTGGLIVIYVNNFLSYGNYSSNGSKGGNANASGGGSGGGSINIFYTNEMPDDVFSVSGGSGGTGGEATGAKGGDGTFSRDIIPEIKNNFFSGELRFNSDMYKNINTNETLFDVNQFFGEL